MKDAIKIFFIITICLIFSLLVNFLELYVTTDVFTLIMLMEIFKLLPIFFASNLLGSIIFGAVSGTTIGVFDGLLSNLKYGTPFPVTVLINILTGILLGVIAVWPIKKTRNPLLLVLVIIGLVLAITIHFYYFVYQSFFMALFAPFYI